MLAFAVTALRYLWPYLLGAAVLGYGYSKAQHWCNTACKTQSARADTAEASIAAAQQRATALALLWAGALDKSDKAIRDAQAQDAAAYAAQQDRVRHLSVLPTLGVSADGWRVLDDASGFANAATAPEVDHRSAQAFSEAALGQYALDAAAAYRDAYTKWASCISTYEEIRNEQIR